MATYDQISQAVGIPKSTLVDWKNADDYRKKLFYALKSMSNEEIHTLMQRAVEAMEKKNYASVSS